MLRRLCGVAGIVAVMACVEPASAAPAFVLSYLSGTSTQAQAAFATAAGIWASKLADNVTINLTVGTGTLGSGILAATDSADGLVSYPVFRSAMIADATGANDATAIADLPNVTSLPIYMNYTSDNPNGFGSATPYLDTSGDNNQYIDMTTANAKALGFSVSLPTLSGCLTACDGFIEFSNSYSYDYDPSNGITGGAFDFVGLAMHEIGHALGFVSGVDMLDYNSSTTFYTANEFTFVSPLDMFRCSAASAAAGAALDFTAGSGTRGFSLNDCATTLANFSTGIVHGDGRQASHWKDNLGLGIMDPTAAPGELLVVTNLDLTAFDVIGWDLASNVPEPSTLLLGATALPALALVRRRRRRAPG